MKKKLRLGFNGKFEDKDVEIAANDPEPWDPSQKFSILGTRASRLDGHLGHTRLPDQVLDCGEEVAIRRE